MEQGGDGLANSTATNPDELMAEGKRCLAAGDAASAVESFQTACSAIADKCGQLSKELAEPYYLYGKALLECARMESNVLGPGMLIPEDEDSSDEEEEEEEDKGDNNGDEAETDKKEPVSDTKSSDHQEQEVPTPQLSASVESGRLNESAGAETSREMEEEGGERGDGAVEGDKESEGDAGPSGEKEEGGMEGGEGSGEAEEETDLKLAWEVLELARVICQREETDEYKLKLSDVYFSLGEVALESDQVEQAVVDMNAGLQLKELLLEPHDRRLAEGHFNLGLAYALQKDHQASIKEYKCARNSLSQRKEMLAGEMESKEGSARKEVEEELADLDSLLPELDNKIKDAEEAANESEKEVTTTFSESTEGSTSKAPISDISHLVRKRPVSERDGEPVGEKAAKRIRTEMLSPDAASNGAANGTTDQKLTAEQ